TLRWQSTAQDGYAAVADIYDTNGLPILDGVPEIVLVGYGNVYVLDSTDGTILWGPEPIPGGQNKGGAPVVADFDGDGLPEIGTAGGAYMIVYDPYDATPILWMQPTKDTSSAITGCTVFDFEADGMAEIIYTDECFVYIYRGSDGSILFKESNNTRTHNEYPIVVDVDGDGNSELLVTSNVCVWACDAEPGWTGPAKRGITVYGDADYNWVRTRKIWNQHAYHVTNINDNGTIPIPEVRNWTVPGLNNFRQNVQTWGVHNAPNLAPEMFGGDVRYCQSGTITLGLMVENKGSRGVPSGVNVSFFRVHDDDSREYLGTVQTQGGLLPGMSEYVEYDWATVVEDPPVNDYRFVVLVDDPDFGEVAVHECLETDNESSIIEVTCNVVD
ncbi:VCBS repeat-containing protein, partial [Myxococcota bacterium]|nr:VCBS repeat-containing protein [Myxococcota bacterium]